MRNFNRLALIAPLSILSFALCGGDRRPAPPQIGLLAAPPRSYWPTRGWQNSTPEQEGIDPAALKKFEEYLFTRSGDEKNRAGIRTNAVVVIRNGKLVYERYARDFSAETPHNSWSVAKSFVNALAGRAQMLGRIDIDQPASRYYAPLRDGRKNEITVRHLLNMSSGLAFMEEYEFAPLRSSVVAMLYTRGKSDMARFTADLEVRAKAGTHVYYSSGDSNLAMAALRAGLSPEEYATLPWRELFDPLGIRATWETDAAGTFVGSSYLYMTARDYAKFGFLYLNDGVWENQRLLPNGWVDFSRTPAPAYATTEPYEALENSVYGAQFHLATGYAPQAIPSKYPDAPEDAFMAKGHWGQVVAIIPSLDVVLVRLGDDRDGTFDANTMLGLLNKAIAN